MAKLWSPKKDYKIFDAKKYHESSIFGRKNEYLPYHRQYEGLQQEELLSLIADARKYRWQALDLSDCGLTELPDALWDLPNLRMLHLGNDFRFDNPKNQLAVLSRNIERLPNLQVLSLAAQAICSEDDVHLYLPNLIRLDLSFTNISQLPDGAANWTNLRELDLRGTHIDRLPDGAANWTNLQALGLSGTNITQLPDAAANWGNLQELYLTGTSISQLPDGAANWTNLQVLDLIETNISQLPDGAANWTNLQELYLSETNISQLPDGAANWTNLQALDLIETNISQLPDGAANWTNLTELDLGLTNITQLPDGAANWTHLTELDLNETPLAEKLPPEARELTGQDLLRYILKLQGNAQREFFHESKLVIAGQAQVGKSSLLKRLVHGTFTQEESTEGIQIEPWRFTRDGEEYRLNIWDFGGQEIYHSTHQFFLTQKTLYLLVWDALSEDEHGRVDYWLRTIQSLAGDSPIFIVINKCDNNIGRIKRIDWDDYQRRYPQIEGIYEVSCRDNLGIDRLREEIQARAINLPLMKQQWFSEWLHARKALEKKAKTENHVSYEKFEEICRENGVTEDDIPTLAKYLHNLGVLMYYHDDVQLRNMVILSSEWGTDAVYKILDQQERQLKGRNGILYADQDLAEIWSDKKRYPQKYHLHLLSLMEKFQLSFRIAPNTHLIAELLETKAIERADLPFAFRETLGFRYDYDFMPAGIMTRFIIAAHEYLDTVDGVKQCWRKGAYLRNGGAYARVVQCDSMPNRHILIQVSGGSPRERQELLTIIRKTLDDKVNSRFENLGITHRIPCICSEGCTYAFKYDFLLTAEEKGQTEVQCQESAELVNLRKLLDGVEVTMDHRRDGQYIDFHPEIKLEVKTETKSESVATATATATATVSVEARQTIDEIWGDLKSLSEEHPELKTQCEAMKNALSELDDCKTNRDVSRSGALSKLRNFLTDCADPESETNKLLDGTKHAAKKLLNLGKAYNKLAGYIGAPSIPLIGT